MLNVTTSLHHRRSTTSFNWKGRVRQRNIITLLVETRRNSTSSWHPLVGSSLLSSFSLLLVAKTLLLRKAPQSIQLPLLTAAIQSLTLIIISSQRDPTKQMTLRWPRMVWVSATTASRWKASICLPGAITIPPRWDTRCPPLTVSETSRSTTVSSTLFWWVLII